MSINDIGKEGERLARLILKDHFRVEKIFQADWLVKANGKWYVVEVKHKEMFSPPPFKGQGLNAYQSDMRLKFQADTGIRCLFLVIDIDGTVYWQWMDELCKTEYFTTKNGIRVFDIRHFKRLPERIRINDSA